ncbi:MAG TPA: gamma subclass chorismate mutase AroQ [Steroidobacteraceae bacterium]|nr:gamma subclass chorismate mutase AroQ [Steroidobacteraceae bacterium]
MGTPGDYAPYALRDAAHDRYSGADIALARELALDLGLRAEFVPTSWRTLLEDGISDRFDIAIGGISVTPERQRSMAFSTAYFHDAKQPVVRCGEQRRYDTRAEIDVPAVRLITNPGGTNESFARSQFPHAALIVHSDNLAVFDEIRAARADVMVTDGVEATLQQQRGQGLCAVKINQRWAPADKAIMMRPDQALQDSVNQSLRRLGASAKYRQRLQSWQADAARPAVAPASTLAALIDERLALVLEVARYKWNTSAAIEDPPREQALLESLRQRAVPLGVPRPVVDRFFTAQIEAAKQLQRELFARWQGEHRDKFPGIADLATHIRPGIDQVTGEMLEALAGRGASSDTLPAASTLAGISPGAVRTARAPLLTREPDGGVPGQ